LFFFFFFSSRRRHTRWPRDWSSDVCSPISTSPLPMTTFWLSAGAAAAVILAVLGVLQYARSGANLLVSVRRYEFELPATAQQAFARLAERISPWSDEPLVGIDDDVAGRVEAVLKVFGIRVGPRLGI